MQVRLLTGIGRYNEMTYVFDLLHQNHRFEMLLRKKMDADRGQVDRDTFKLNSCLHTHLTFNPVLPAAELQSENGPAGLHQALPPCRQRETQHGGAVLQHEEGDRREPRDGGEDAAEDHRVSGLG